MKIFATTLVALLVVNIFSAKAATVTQAEFNAAITKNGFKTPSAEIYNNFVKGASKYSKEEQAMFLAQLLHESAGFRYTEELSKYITNKKYSGNFYDTNRLTKKKIKQILLSKNSMPHGQQMRRKIRGQRKFTR